MFLAILVRIITTIMRNSGGVAGGSGLRGGVRGVVAALFGPSAVLGAPPVRVRNTGKSTRIFIRWSSRHVKNFDVEVVEVEDVEGVELGRSYSKSSNPAKNLRLK